MGHSKPPRRNVGSSSNSRSIQPGWGVFLILLFFVARPSFADGAPAADDARPLEAEEVTRLEPVKKKQLLSLAQLRCEVSPQLEGVLLVKLELGNPNDQRERAVVLEGRVAYSTQRQLAARIVSEVMQSESFWSTSDDEFVVLAEKLTVMQPSSIEGAKTLSMAIEQFRLKRYDQAAPLFSSALADSATTERDAIQYWKAVNDIARNETQLAERRLEFLIRKNPKAPTTYASRIEQVQGPLRRSLSELEQTIMVRIRQGTNSDVK